MISDLKPCAYKGCKIAAQLFSFLFLFGQFCLSGRIYLVSVLLSTSAERCFVSRMRDFKARLAWNFLCWLSWNISSSLLFTQLIFRQKNPCNIWNMFNISFECHHGQLSSWDWAISVSILEPFLLAELCLCFYTLHTCFLLTVLLGLARKTAPLKRHLETNKTKCEKSIFFMLQ